MSSKALLLDMDGVVFHQPRVSKYLVQKIAGYVRKNAPHVHTVEQGVELNRFLYTNYGHTHIGLRAVYGNDAPSLKHFHKHVYDADMMTYLNIHKKDADFEKRSVEVYHLLQDAKRKDVPVYIFSNAPMNWCEAVIRMMYLTDFIPEERVLCSDHPVFQDSLLKPDRKLYTSVSDFIKNTHYDKGMELVFVDDSFSNLKPVVAEGTWKPVFFSNDGISVTSRHIHTITNLDQLHPMI